MRRFVRAVSPYFAQALTSTRLRDLRRFAAERRRRRAREPHRVRYFHQVDDPYSHLAAQVLGTLLERYDVVLEPHLVGPPPDDAAPERERLEAYSRKDAADVAPFYGLEFPASAPAPAPADAWLATRLLVTSCAAGCFLEDALRVGDALFRGDRTRLEKLATDIAPAAPEATRRALEEGSALRQRTGHYLGATFSYGGEWYWGVDRLGHLERRLQGLDALRAGAPAEPIVARPELCQAPLASSRRLKLEYFPSLRSPYSAIAMARVLRLPERLPVDLVLRPVLPMVMRGLPVPREKRLYILFDTKREAEAVGEPFGFACDPVGRPVERAFSLFPWARDRGRGGELLHSFTRAAFAEGIDTGTDDGLRRVVERAGLPWPEALPHLDADDWRPELEENRRAMFEHGLWGVPSFRLLGEDGEPDFCTWGQDRIWRVEEEVRRRVGESSGPPPGQRGGSSA